MTAIDVILPSGRHSILIEPGLLERLGALAGEAARPGPALLAVDAAIASTHGRTAEAALASAGWVVHRHEIVAEERAKTLETVRGVYDAMLAARLERGSTVFALGGGITGDVAGFAAATFLRGVGLVQVPTTLLAMVDAAIGGKTGVNLPLPAPPGGRRTLGKNLVGAFWQPLAVFADPTVLRTLDPRDFRCGLAECVKHGIIADADLLALLEAERARIAALDLRSLTTLIAWSAAIKTRIVEEDEREAGRRALLNLGHTFAHAIEPIETLDLRHGEAVAIGLCAAARLAAETGRLASRDADRVERLLADLDLPTRLPGPVDVDALMTTMGYDKKVAGGRVRLVLPTALGRAEVVDGIPPGAIAAAWAAVSPGTAPERAGRA